MPDPRTGPVTLTISGTSAALLARLAGDPMRLGDTDLVDGWHIETHTLGCRNHADTPEADWWDEHWAIFDEYDQDGVSVTVGDPADGIFTTLTPRRAG